ncbi:hypothetical protein RWV98_14325 [Agathobaculum sp. NTUH-O15-33]|nr:hypothetical protein [Agathobaculum sp. NTUH-O15-33]WNX83757.1 hypothetical protein RWV98_14325 [Agathobaculum sp. NTUH-O15-33]
MVSASTTVTSIAAANGTCSLSSTRLAQVSINSRTCSSSCTAVSKATLI